MRTDDFDYILPPDRIAQEPLPRGESRLLVLERESGSITHRHFSDILDYLSPGDLLALNDTRVTARRVRAWPESGHEGEALLLRHHGERGWEALVRPGKRFKIATSVEVEGPGGMRLFARVTGSTPEGGRLLELQTAEERDSLDAAGTAPLPPYIKQKLEDEERYQTVYASAGGSAAAPTAGLHFTDELLKAAQLKGVELVRLTLHVGIDTFRPVRVDSIEEHAMHGEPLSIQAGDAERVNMRRGRLIAVGTTTVRALESSADEAGKVVPGDRETRLFIVPGYRFRAVQSILTNFHLPKSTLLMMISAFAGREQIMAAYGEAIREGYRFYSFGDAMLIL
jgi:S-adenosylmethionine:tRNA ribosyltransferase-isomerase